MLVAVLVEAQDPGNAGTVIRCADAAGAAAVVLTSGSVDPQSGKAVRASAGSLFHLPVVTGATAAVVIDRLRDGGYTVLAADGTGVQDLDDAEAAGLLSRPTAWLFGNEARGLSDDVLELADHVVRVPIYGQAESLNLATAAAVCLYASARAQR
nr:RNA methyltransferase [Phytoactinopolyspora mesophila]